MSANSEIYEMAAQIFAGLAEQSKRHDSQDRERLRFIESHATNLYYEARPNIEMLGEIDHAAQMRRFALEAAAMWDGLQSVLEPSDA